MPPRKRTEPSKPDAEAPADGTPMTPTDGDTVTGDGSGTALPPVDEPSPEPDAEQQPAIEQPDCAPGEPEPGTVTLAVTWPHDSFVTEDGTEITADGTAVPVDRDKDIRAEAKAAGVTIRKVN